jgi:CubicO group peptidase (beta-lactamase class C family)
MNLEHRLATIAERHGVPGAAVGILHGDTVTEAAYGVLNRATGVAATTDSLFQIGSITKVWTATVVMRLVDDGLLDLDAPLVDVLPELLLRDADVTRKLTMRHLLTHTSGIDGDIFTDTGRGDDCLKKYVALLGDAALTHPLGATWSYSNSGYSLAGRVIEKLTGDTWDAALRELLFQPLGLTHTVTLPEEALLFRTAVGHLPGADGKPEPASQWGIPRSAGPAGGVTATVADVLRFARMHLNGGRSADGAAVLSAASTTAMAAHQVELPDKHTVGDSWGLGWERMGWDGHRVRPDSAGVRDRAARGDAQGPERRLPHGRGRSGPVRLPGPDDRQLDGRHVLPDRERGALRTLRRPRHTPGRVRPTCPSWSSRTSPYGSAPAGAGPWRSTV